MRPPSRLTSLFFRFFSQELQFRELCEFLVRLAAMRYRALPNLERRVNTLILAHLLHQVGA